MNKTIGNSFLIQKKFMKLIGSDFRIYDSQKNEILFAHLKGFKLKEDITLYSDDSKIISVINIKARSIIDFSSAYDFYDAAGKKIGAVKRKGFSSIFRDEWIIMNSESDVEIGKIYEDNFLLAVLRRFVTSLIPEKFVVLINGKQVASYQNNFNPFISKVSVEISDTESYSAEFGIAVGVLLCAIEGKKS